MTLRNDIAPLISGEAKDDAATIRKFSRDTSIFERNPAVVVFPKDADDVSAVVKFASERRKTGEHISIAARSAGTDMTGGPLTDSISLVFTEHMNRVLNVAPDSVTAEPGVYYRDLEKETLEKTGRLIPSYPASRELCAFGGMLSNNSGGELTLQYGKTNRYIRSLDVVLADGTQTTFAPIPLSQLSQYEARPGLEGSIYSGMRRLIELHENEIRAAKPTVTKNSAGYALWNVIDREKQTFDLAQLTTGSQGTLAVITKGTVGTVKLPAHRSMLVIFLTDIDILPTIVHRVLTLTPESFESYDDQTFKLAVRFLPQIMRQFGLKNMLGLGLSFIPELWAVMTGGVPKLVLMAEFADDDADAALARAKDARDMLLDLPVRTKIARSEIESKKYWTVRREAFALLRKNLQGLYAAPFIDDLVVHPDDFPHFWPELNALLSHHKLLYTIQGHIGDGNFHIIPLMNLAHTYDHDEILQLMPKVYELIAKYHGSITGEHNDGIIRTPYLPIMFSESIIRLFAETKNIFDPLGILNPGKKVGGTREDIERSMIRHS